MSTGLTSTASLPLTGERTVPGIPDENYWFRRHEVAYNYLVEHLLPTLRPADGSGLRILEAGCGEGYGAAMLAAASAPAGSVLGLDYDAQTIAHVATRYQSVRPARGDLQRLPAASGSLDLVVNLQVIEHLHDQPGFLRECARVLAPGGTLVVSTPNRITFSPGLDAPINPFHTRELDASELAELLEPCFDLEAALGIHHGSSFAAVPDIVDQLIANAPEDWSPALRSFVLGVGASDFDIKPEDIDDSLDLFFIAKVRG